MNHEARYYRSVGDRIVCELCPRECTLAEGQRAFCFVRKNEGGKMVLTTYGRSSGFCVDPIEKKPLNHFYPGTAVLSFGTAGCNLGCKFCQNWSISKAREWDRLADRAGPADIAEAAQQSGCRSVAFTYNDPVIFAEYAMDTARECRKLGIKTVAVTAGYISPGAREEFFAEIDAANVDLKAFDDDFYRKVSSARLQPVLDTLVYLKRETDVWFEITNLVIPGYNDSHDQIARMCDWLMTNLGPDVPVHFSAFHPDFKMLDVPPTPPETLARARSQAREHGLLHVYTGNVHDKSGQSTYCGACGGLLIERDWYSLGEFHIMDGNCGHCSAPVPGHFENAAGTWGPRRLPIVIG